MAGETSTQYVAYTLYKADPAWLRLPIEERNAGKEAFAEVVASWQERMELRSYSLVGVRPEVDFMLWKLTERYDEKRVHERHRDHSLFIAFAPADAPTIALGILVENGGHGSTAAAPIARKVMDFYLLGKEPEIAPASSNEEPEGD